MIKTIIFDLSEVIIAGYVGVEHIVEKNTGIGAEEFLIQKFKTESHFWFDAMRGKITEDEYIRQLFAGTNWKMSVEEFKRYFRQNLDNIVSGTFEIIDKLKGNYRLVLLSDHIREMTDYILERHKRLNVFGRIIWSFELGQIKTDDGALEKVLKMLDVPAEEVLFIDDSPRNISRAGEIGINTILFTCAGDLEKQLVKKKLISAKL